MFGLDGSYPIQTDLVKHVTISEKTLLYKKSQKIENPHCKNLLVSNKGMKKLVYFKQAQFISKQAPKNITLNVKNMGANFQRYNLSS